MTSESKSGGAEFKKGQCVAWDERQNLVTYSEGSGSDKEDPMRGVVEVDGPDPEGDVYVKVDGRYLWWVSASALRHEPAEEQKFYMTQPSVLPKTLPAGTRFRSGPGDYDFEMTRPGKLDTDGRSYSCGSYRYLPNGNVTDEAGLAWVEEIYWPGVPLQEDAPARASADDEALREAIRAAATEPARPSRDPYAEHAAQLAKRLDYLAPAPLDRMVAAATADHPDARNKTAQALRMLDDKLPGRPLRTGPLRDRDAFGQRLALRGWDSDDV